MDSVYYTSLEKTWFHQYLNGHYFSRTGEPFLMVKIDDIHNDNSSAVQKRDTASETYKALYREENMGPIHTFLHNFFVENRHTLFYHLYWMGHVCDANGVPFYLKNKSQFKFSKTYQNQFEKNNENFETYMKKQRDMKQKNAQRKKQHEKTLKNKKNVSEAKAYQTKQTTSKRKSFRERIQDSGAVYVGEKSRAQPQMPDRKTVPSKSTPQFRNDTHATYVGEAPQNKRRVTEYPSNTSRPKPSIEPEKATDPDAFINPSAKMISTRLTKNRRFRKKKSLKSKMRQLKIEMANLL